MSDVSGREAAPDALDGEPAAVEAGAAGVGHEPVALDDDRVLLLGHLDGDVRGEARRIREPVVAVRLRRAAPRADDELVEDEAAAAGPVGAEDRERVPALPGRGHPLRDQLRERTVDRVEDAEARHAAHRGRARHHHLRDRARPRQHVDGPERAGGVRHLDGQRRPHGLVGARLHERARAVERAAHHRRRVGQVDRDLVAGDRDVGRDRDVADVDAVGAEVVGERGACRRARLRSPAARGAPCGRSAPRASPRARPGRAARRGRRPPARRRRTPPPARRGRRTSSAGSARSPPGS